MHKKSIFFDFFLLLILTLILAVQNYNIFFNQASQIMLFYIKKQNIFTKYILSINYRKLKQTQ